MFRLVKVFRPCRNTNGHLGGDGPEDDEVAELLGHSCKTGNVRYGGTSKTQN